ncbi:MAG TPA: MoxR family ATPase [Desulfobulbus sp.]|nr:MoxR family ATPase [Desulfobulbus sp.]
MKDKVSIPNLQHFSIEEKTELDFDPPWPDRAHSFERQEAVAIQAALLSGRPLLVEGPPGSGKTQLAAAAAAVLGRELITFVVNSNTRPEDLLWQYDALQRLNDAQADKLQKIEKYLAKGPLWLALDGGDTYADIRSSTTIYKPKKGASAGKVVLIDEIDKADRSVPNSLLEVLGHRRFYCPHLNEEIMASEDRPLPLVVITSNREQQLPPAFVRRCLALRIGLPNDQETFVEKLARRAKMHFGADLERIQYKEIAEELWAWRQRYSSQSEELQPGQAEYFDLVRAIARALKQGLADEKRQKRSFADLLRDMRGLAFDKQGLQDERGPRMDHDTTA